MVSEFITYQIHNQPSKNLLPPIGAYYSSGTTTPGTSNALPVTCYPPNSALGGFQMGAAIIQGVGTYNNFIFNSLDVEGSDPQSAIPPVGK